MTAKYRDPSFVAYIYEVTKLHNDTIEIGHPQTLADESHVKGEADSRLYRKLKNENRELGLLQEEMLRKHENLNDKLNRMSENLKKMTYAEAMESKNNITTNKLNR